MPPPAQQPSSQGDNSLAPFWIIVGIFAVCWIIWYFAHTQISMAVLKVRLWETDLIALFVPSIGHIQTAIQNISPANASFNDLAAVSSVVGKYLRIPAIIILSLLAIAVYFSNPLLRYKKTYTIQQLVQDEKYSWPQIMPVANLDLVNTDIDQGPWAMALSPMQFAKKHRLLQEERIVPTDNNLRQQAKLTVSVRREEAQQVFSVQLGRYWTGIDHLNSHTKALFAAFAARAARDADASRNFLMRIAASTEKGKLDFSGTEELLKKYKDQKAVERVTQNHAFVLTVMAEMLLLARTDGVLATADFLWLKPVDRSLWFMLNSVGRQTPFPEISGSFAHWLAECALKRKLSVPMVDTAVAALEVAIKDIIYIPDEEEERERGE